MRMPTKASRSVDGSLPALGSRPRRAMPTTAAMSRMAATVPTTIATLTELRLPGRRRRGGLSVVVAVAEHPAAHPAHRVPVLVGDALLERDDGVVGDVDVFRTDLRAALGDVAVGETTLLARLLGAVKHILGLHLEAGHAYEEARPVETVEEAVGAVDVAHVLAQVALDALAELVEAVDVGLADAPRRAVVRGVGERRDRPVDLVVARDVGDQVLDERKCLHGPDGDRTIGEVVDARLAHQRR